MDSFHHHLDELERVVQNSERMKALLEEDGVLCYAAYSGLNRLVETLIQKGVGKEKTYSIVGNITLNIGIDRSFRAKYLGHLTGKVLWGGFWKCACLCTKLYFSISLTLLAKNAC